MALLLEVDAPGNDEAVERTNRPALSEQALDEVTADETGPPSPGQLPSAPSRAVPLALAMVSIFMLAKVANFKPQGCANQVSFSLVSVIYLLDGRSLSQQSRSGRKLPAQALVRNAQEHASAVVVEHEGPSAPHPTITIPAASDAMIGHRSCRRLVRPFCHRRHCA